MSEWADFTYVTLGVIRQQWGAPGGNGIPDAENIAKKVENWDGWVCITSLLPIYICMVGHALVGSSLFLVCSHYELHSTESHINGPSNNHHVLFLLPTSVKVNHPECGFCRVCLGACLSAWQVSHLPLFDVQFTWNNYKVLQNAVFQTECSQGWHSDLEPGHTLCFTTAKPPVNGPANQELEVLGQN